MNENLVGSFLRHSTQRLCSLTLECLLRRLSQPARGSCECIRGAEIGCFHNQTVREEAFVHGQPGWPHVRAPAALRVRLLVPPAPTAAMGSRLRAATAAEGADPDFGAEREIFSNTKQL